MATFKSNLLKFQNIVAGDMSTASITSYITNILNLDNIGVEAVWSGTSPVGSLAVLVSIDYAQDSFGNVTNSGTWVTLTSLTTTVSGNTGAVYFDINQISAPWLKVVYTKVSGVGTLNCYIAGKMV